MTTLTNRAWDELRAAGGALSEDHICSACDIIDLIAPVSRQFEVCKDEREETVHVLLNGLLDALEGLSVAEACAAAD